jgi:hypothetical protein
MGVATSRPDACDEGYSQSSEADLDPGPDLSETLDDADRVASDEHGLCRRVDDVTGRQTMRTRFIAGSDDE